MQRNKEETLSRFSDTMYSRTQWVKVFKILKDKHCPPKSLSTAKLSFKNKGERICFYKTD